MSLRLLSKNFFSKKIHSESMQELPSVVFFFFAWTSSYRGRNFKPTIEINFLKFVKAVLDAVVIRDFHIKHTVDRMNTRCLTFVCFVA
jgi:hypothetical protein